MKLPSRRELIARIKDIRKAIRSHRDAKGDDRCHLDDYKVWASISESAWTPIKLPPYNEMMATCLEFYTHRRAETADPVPEGAIRSPRFWNVDLDQMTTKQLKSELSRLTKAITRHWVIVPRPRTTADDRELYAMLPEKMPADFRLPPEEEFLGEALAPHAGCPSFYRSHAGCPKEKSCNVHQWGPCHKK
ncbi:MAG: hypothetical protein AAB455_01540 [Patescibacteria group bacterium]